MMNWIAKVANGDPTGFWINVLAGIPYFFFDIIIITMLLPITLQWWEERRWRTTRKKAINYLIRTYWTSYQLSGRTYKLAMSLADTPFTDEFFTSERQAEIELLIKEWKELSAKLELELQTALSILGPEISQELLDFHYAWREWLDALSQKVERFTFDHRQFIPTFLDTLDERAARVDALGRHLVLSYSDNELMMRSLQQSRAYLFDVGADGIRYQLERASYRATYSGWEEWMRETLSQEHGERVGVITGHLAALKTAFVTNPLHSRRWLSRRKLLRLHSDPYEGYLK